MGNNYNFTEAAAKLMQGGKKKIQAKERTEVRSLFTKIFNNQMFVK